MASHLFVFLLFSLISLQLDNVDSVLPLDQDLVDGNRDPPPGDIDGWCQTVPHPGPCRFFMSRKPKLFKPSCKAEFLRMTVQVALDRAMAAQTRAWRWGQDFTSHKELAAWTDCVRLYDLTVLQLNSTFHGLTNNNATCTGFDVQTWLSTALTNLQTCRAGSDELNVTSLVWPRVAFNVSELISNGLAINSGIVQVAENQTSTTKGGFPNWVTGEDRRLLRSRKLATANAEFVVAKDGTGQYTTVQAAIDVAAKSSVAGRKVIYVKKGVYRENVYVNPYTSDIMLVGDGIKETIIIASRSASAGYTTYNSATAAVDGPRFIARGITFQNTAGPANGQAVAFRSASDLSVFYRCAFYGYQDTLFVHSQRQFYKMCYVIGTIDIIFGNAAVVFQNCMILVRKPITGQANVVTAQGRDDPNQNTGIVIHRSQIIAAPDLVPVTRNVSTYLGRPWQEYSRTVIMKTYLGPLVNNEGWLAWNADKFLSTLYYAEYRNFGPGSTLKMRVKWAGFHIITRPSIASGFTVGTFIAGRSWLPDTGVPFIFGI